MRSRSYIPWFAASGTCSTWLANWRLHAARMSASIFRPAPRRQPFGVFVPADNSCLECNYQGSEVLPTARQLRSCIWIRLQDMRLYGPKVPIKHKTYRVGLHFSPELPNVCPHQQSLSPDREQIIIFFSLYMPGITSKQANKQTSKQKIHTHTHTHTHARAHTHTHTHTQN